MHQTLIALRIFVNDEINELEFALRCVASQFLKPINGTLIVKLNAVSMINLISNKKVSGVITEKPYRIVLTCFSGFRTKSCWFSFH